MYNGVTHFRDFGSKNVPKISRGLKLEGFLLLYIIDFIDLYTFSKFANSFQNDQVIIKRLYKKMHKQKVTTLG